MTDKHPPEHPPKSLFSDFPRIHLVVAGIAVSVLFLALLLPSGEVQANRTALPLPLTPLAANPEAPLLPAASIDLTQTTADSTAPTGAQIAVDPAPQWQEFTVQKGDNLARLFERVGISAAEMQQILDTGPAAHTLTRIYPGQKLSFRLDDQGHLQALRYQEDRLESTEIDRTDNGFEVRKISREPDIKQVFASGRITSTLYEAAHDAGLNDGQIIQLAKIFSGEIDFALDLRKGDQFAVLYEQHYLDGKRIGRGGILAASITNRGETHTAVRYVYADGGVQYFTPDGVSMRKTFLRAPLDVLRVTSNFSLHRYHPLLKITRPHYGIDYGAPVGTPVYAAGDGVVVRSSYNRSCGNFVMIRHSGTYATRYLHLSKRRVKVGERVHQGEVIGAVGATGYATGPHLHYEFLVNGVHRDPRLIAKLLPRAKQLAGADKRRFLAQTAPLKQQFAAYITGSEPAKVATAAPTETATQL